MLIQLGHENVETGEFSLVEQREVKDENGMKAFRLDVTKRIPLPEGFRLIAVKEGDSRFLMTKEEK